MISYLEGIVKFKRDNYIILFTQGVGYKVFVPLETISQLVPEQKSSLFIYTYVKDDALDLYGFPTQDDLSLFELFLGVSGIGPRTAISIFASGKLAKIKEAIVKGDVDFFTTVPRLGKKNAQKIIIEIRPKLGSLGELDLTGKSGETKEIMEALKSFGFTSAEAKEAIRAIKNVEGDTSVKIRQALKYLGKKTS